jgi:hypothetical protein
MHNIEPIYSFLYIVNMTYKTKHPTSLIQPTDHIYLTVQLLNISPLSQRYHEAIQNIKPLNTEL